MRKLIWIKYLWCTRVIRFFIGSMRVTEVRSTEFDLRKSWLKEIQKLVIGYPPTSHIIIGKTERKTFQMKFDLLWQKYISKMLAHVY